jgi:hypothetical protein
LSHEVFSAQLGASIVSKSGEEYFDTAGDREVKLVPGTAIYRRSLQIPLSTPPGIYRLIGAVWFPRIGERRLATVDRGFIINIKTSKIGFSYSLP